MALAATFSPATPSQLSSSILAAAGCKGCSLPVLRWETVSLSETLRLGNEGGSQGSCKSKFICICKIYNYVICKWWQGSACMEGSAFPSLTSSTKHLGRSISCWTTSLFLNCGSKAFKVKKLFPTFVWKLGTTLLAPFKYRPGLSSSQTCTLLISVPHSV